MKRIGMIGIVAALSLAAACVMFPPSKPKPQLDAPSPQAVLEAHPPQDALAPPTPEELATAQPTPAPPQTSTPMPGPEASACHVESFQGLVGQTLTDANRSILPPKNRVICMGCMATMEFVADRLTVQLGPNNTIASVRCG
jgi:hypothetical protein